LIAAYVLLSVSIYTILEIAAVSNKKEPSVVDPGLKVETIYQGKVPSGLHDLRLLSPVSQFSFLDDNDILLLSKVDGKVLRIQNNTLLPEPLLDVNVTSQLESGLLGIAVAKNVNQDKTFVFLYYTELKNGDAVNSTAGNPSQNKLYRYELLNNKLKNPKLIFTTPTPNRYSHIGGAMAIDPSNDLYLTVGDMHGDRNVTTRTMAQNYISGKPADGRAGILRFTLDGDPVGNGILGQEYPVNLYYAYGIRNSFGLDFDPISGKLWESENGRMDDDEINLIEPGFNGGWNKIIGIHKVPKNFEVQREQSEVLVDFDGKGKYGPPKFIWNKTIAPTALKFLKSAHLGEEYENDLLVASYNSGDIYDFNLNKNRTHLVLANPVSDRLGKKSEFGNLIFARDLGKITDMEVSPDGNMYVLSKFQDAPTIFRISPINEK